MPRSRYRKGRKDHNERVRNHRIATAMQLLEAGEQIIAKQVAGLTEQHPPLIPFASEPING